MRRRFREIVLHRLLAEVLRTNYAADSAWRINVLYKFLLCLLYPLEAAMGGFLREERRRLYLKASCSSCVGQIENVLNMLYMGLTADELAAMRASEPQVRPPIRCANSGEEDYFLYPQNLSGAPVRYWPPQNAAGEADFYLYPAATSLRTFVVSVPASFTASPEYADFVATLNAFMILPIVYTIQTREDEAL